MWGSSAADYKPKNTRNGIQMLCRGPLDDVLLSDAVVEVLLPKGGFFVISKGFGAILFILGT